MGKVYLGAKGLGTIQALRMVPKLFAGFMHKVNLTLLAVTHFYDGMSSGAGILE